MSVSPITVIARITAKPDCADPVRIIMTAVAEATRRESGCLSYQLLHSLADYADFTTVEVWATPDAERAHFSTPHVQEALQRLPPLLDTPPDIRRYRVLP